MFIKTKIALAVAIGLSTAVTVSAAPRNDRISDKVATPQSDRRTHATAPSAGFDPYSPAVTGGGSIGYNQIVEHGW